MPMPPTKRDVNEYLFHEFGFDTEPSGERTIADNWPFELAELGMVDAGGESWRVFGFAQADEEFFAVANGAMNFLPREGMDIDALAMQLEGQCWIGDQDPVDLARTEGPESDTPPVPERVAAIEALVAELDSAASFEILDGLYLKRRKEYLAFVQDRASGRCHIVGDRVRLRNIPFPQVSPWRRLAIGIGKIVRAGLLT